MERKKKRNKRSAAHDLVVRNGQEGVRARSECSHPAHAFPAFRVNVAFNFCACGKKTLVSILLIYSENYMQLPPPPSARRHLRLDGDRERSCTDSRRSRDSPRGRRASERVERAAAAAVAAAASVARNRFG